jgi:ribose 5-phosphate isomerase A
VGLYPEGSFFMKKNATISLLDYIQQYQTIGFGTGSIVNFVIEQISAHKLKIKAMSSSSKTVALLKKCNIPLISDEEAQEAPLYIEEVDAYNDLNQSIKNSTCALSKEKSLAYTSKFFVCLVNQKITANEFNTIPISVEVLPIARSYVARALVKLGGKPIYRNGFVTENQNILLDTYHLPLHHPIALEKEINNIPGVVANGIFAVRPADILIINK